MDTNDVKLDDVLGFKGKSTGTYYIGVVMEVVPTDEGQCLEVRFWMPKGKRLDARRIQLTNLDGVDFIGTLPNWAEWDE